MTRRTCALRTRVRDQGPGSEEEDPLHPRDHHPLPDRRTDPVAGRRLPQAPGTRRHGDDTLLSYEDKGVSE